MVEYELKWQNGTNLRRIPYECHYCGHSGRFRERFVATDPVYNIQAFNLVSARAVQSCHMSAALTKTSAGATNGSGIR